MVVLDSAPLDARRSVRDGGQDRVDDPWIPVVRGPADGPHVDDLPPSRKLPLPGQARVGDAEDVRAARVQEPGQERVRARAFPQELVRAARAPVAEQHLGARHRHTDLRGELAHPRAVRGIGVVVGISIGE